MSEEFLFDVLSSDGVTNYLVSVRANQERLVVTCNCKAGVLGKLCKHKVAVVSANLLDTDSETTPPTLVARGARELLNRSSLGAAFQQYLDAEAQFERAKRAFDLEKKSVESLMQGKKR